MANLAKTKPWRSPRYLAWVRSQPCASCGRPATDAHHENEPGQGTLGGKCGDERTIPLCRECHDLRHLLGRGVLWWLDVEAVILRLNWQWVEMGNRIGRAA